MITQQGRVVAIDDEEAVVRIGGTSGCPSCDAGKGCGAGVFGRMLRRNPVTVQVPNVIDAQPGQAVGLCIPEARFLALVFRLYALPLLAGLMGAVVGHVLAARMSLGGFSADLWTLVMALGSAGLVMVWSRRHLGEFPLSTTVHLVLPEAQANLGKCGEPGGGPPAGNKPDKYDIELSKR